MATKKEQLLRLLNQYHEYREANDIDGLADEIISLFENQLQTQYDVALLNRLYSAQLLIEDSIEAYAGLCGKVDYQKYVSHRMR